MAPGEEREGEAEEQRRVGRDREARERHPGERGEGEAGDAPCPVAPEAAGEDGDDDRGAGMDQRQRQADPEAGVAAELGRETEDPADQRRLRIIAPGELLPPEPVLGVVDEEVGGGEGEERDPPEGDEGDAGEAEGEGPAVAAVRPGAWRHG